MKILIVGGAGYVGGAVTDILLSHCSYPASFSFLVYDSLLYEESYRKPVPFLRGDIRDRQRLLPLLREADCVIWLAAVVGDAACALDPAAATEVNQDSVRWLAGNFSGRIIFLSTCSVYGAAGGELTESSPTNPLSVYAATKLAAEGYLAGHPNAIAFRLGTLFGLSDTYSRVRFDLVLNTLTLRAFTDGRITIFGGEQWRPLLHVRDAAAAIVSAISSSATGIYNLHHSNYQISDLADQVAAEFPNLQIQRTPTKFEDNRNYRVDSRKARKELGFNPTLTTIPTGIREVKTLLEEGRLASPMNPRYWNDRYLATGAAAAGSATGSATPAREAR